MGHLVRLRMTGRFHAARRGGCGSQQVHTSPLGQQLREPVPPCPPHARSVLTSRPTVFPVCSLVSVSPWAAVTAGGSPLRESLPRGLLFCASGLNFASARLSGSCQLCGAPVGTQLGEEAQSLPPAGRKQG